MREREDSRTVPLSVRLQSELGFEFDQNKELLVKDNLFTIGHVELYEELPTRTRVSVDGVKLEIGAKKADIEGLLALARIVEPTAQRVDHVTNFWQGSSNVKTSEDEDWIFLNSKINPTPRGLEEGWALLRDAYHLAIKAGIKNKSRDQISKEGGFFDAWTLKDIEDPQRQRGVYIPLFPEKQEIDDEDEDGDSEAEESCEIRPRVTVDTLREYPLRIEGNVNGLYYVPSTLRYQEKTMEIVDSMLTAYNGTDPKILNGSDTVTIIFSDHNYGILSDMRLFLQIPKDIRVDTIEDIGKLNEAELSISRWEGIEDNKQRMQVNVEVEKDSVRISSPENGFELELRKPVCAECQIPFWQFPHREDVVRKFDSDSKNLDDTPFLYGYNTSLGIMRCLPNFEEGEKHTYCADCITGVAERFKQDHPLASRKKAMEIARQKLDELGYQGLEIWDDHVSRRRTQQSEATDRWEIFTKIEYERDGRKITRYTGEPILKDDGEFQPNMLSLEYVNFRHH